MLICSRHNAIHIHRREVDTTQITDRHVQSRLQPKPGSVCNPRVVHQHVPNAKPSRKPKENKKSYGGQPKPKQNHQKPNKNKKT